MKLPHTEDSKKYRTIGGALTVTWFALIAAYLIASGHNIFSMEPNEFGDFLAGALGPVGILWLILGFWQQGDELRSSVKALELQSEELRNSVEQQKALVEVTRKQADAEINALHEEREARKRASMPNLVLASTGGSSISPNRISASFVLRNIGADCSNLKVIDLSADEFPNVIRTVPTLRYGEAVDIAFTHGELDHLEFKLRVLCETRNGDVETFDFWLSRARPQAIGFTIEKLG